MDPGSESLVLDSRLEAIDLARRFARARAELAGFDADGVSAIELALTEALSNVIVHAYGGRPDGEIGLTITVDDSVLRLEVLDNGRPFDPEGYSPPDLSEPGRGGYGIMLIETLMDDVARERRPDGHTCLSLAKRRPPGVPHA